MAWKKARPATFLLRLVRREIANHKAFAHLCKQFQPQVIYIWNAAHISLTLAFKSQYLGYPVCYYISDNWLSSWKDDLWYSLWHRVPERFLSRCAKNTFRLVLSSLRLLNLSSSLDFSHAQFTSQFMKTFTLEAGIPVSNSAVIHWGIDTQKYKYRKSNAKRSRLLFVGQLVKHKGVHTAIEALNLINEQYGLNDLTLTIAGGGVEPEYERHLRQLTASLKLESNIVFTGPLPRTEVITLYQNHDILVFPSLWNEPFSITLLEGMSAGLAVVGTDTGGTTEILENEKNSLTFSAGDAEKCASQIMRLIANDDLFERVRKNGRLTVEDRFTFDTMMDEIENSLARAVFNHNAKEALRSQNAAVSNATQ